MSKRIKIDYDTTDMEFQRLFHESTKPKVYLSAGFGSGKTYSLCMKALRLMRQNPGMPGGLLAPSYKMYKRDVVPTLRDICRHNKISYKYLRGDNLWKFPGNKSKIYGFTAEDDGESVKGPNLAWGAINEVTLCSKQAVMMLVGRVRLKRAKFLQIAMSGTPEGFNWTYEYFIEYPREDTDLIYGDSRLNKHIHGSYIKNLEESYDKLMQEQYIKGMFVNLKGNRCAWAFDRLKQTATDVERVPHMPVWVSLDFNVTPMAATLWNHVPINFPIPNDNHRGRTLRAFDEIEITSSNTYEMCAAIKEKLQIPSSNQGIENVFIYPDPAGGARSTKTRNFTDFDILREAGFKNLKYRTQVSVRDCLNSLNGMLGKDAIVLNSKRCPNTIADYEQCIFKGNVFEIDKSNMKRSHWLDGSKNMCEYEFPIRKPFAREERAR